MTKRLTLLGIATLCVIALSAVVGVRLADAAAGNIYNLGTLGGDGSSGADINDAGQAVGAAQDTVGRSRAFLWDSSRGMTGLGTANGYTGAAATAINASGSVAGVEYGSEAGVYHAFAWRPNEANGTTGTMTNLAFQDASSANDINAAGQAVGYSYSNYYVDYDEGCTPDAPYYPNCGGGYWVNKTSAVLWENGVGSDLTNSSASEVAYAINDAGQVAGSFLYNNDDHHAFRYDSSGVMHDLGTLGGSVSVGKAINNAGLVVGESWTTGNTALRAFRYTGTPGAGGVMVELGTLGGTYNQVFDINEAGFVVGSAHRAAGAGDGFWATLWLTDAGNTAVDLDAWLDAINPTLGAYWDLLAARAINSNGLITGTGTYNDGPGGLSDGSRAFVLDASSLVHPIPGDFNHDNTVDAADYVAWRKTSGSPDDYNTWQTNFARTLNGGLGATGSASAPVVPEPTSLTMLVLTALAGCIVRRSRISLSPSLPVSPSSAGRPKIVAEIGRPMCYARSCISTLDL